MIVNDYYKNNKDVKMFKTTYFENKDKDKDQRLSVITEKSYFDDEDTTIIY